MWYYTFKGHLIDLTMSPGTWTLDADDISNALSKICRWGGQLGEFYSVAQHSVLMCREAEGLDLKRACLLHDATEAYLGDVISPIKQAMLASGASFYKDLEDRLHRALEDRYGLKNSALTCSEVQHLDRRMLHTEAREITGYPGRDAKWLLWLPPPFDMRIVSWDHARARREFCEAWQEVGL